MKPKPKPGVKGQTDPGKAVITAAKVEVLSKNRKEKKKRGKKMRKGKKARQPDLDASASPTNAGKALVDVDEEEEDEGDSGGAALNPDFKFELTASSDAVSGKLFHHPAAALASPGSGLPEPVSRRLGHEKTSVDALIQRRLLVSRQPASVADNGAEPMDEGEQAADASAGVASTVDLDLVDADEVKLKAKRAKKKGNSGPVTPGFAEEIDTPELAAGDSFLSLNLSRPLLRALAEFGWPRPTPIQAACIPVALAGRDICACARTGSGKTAAFLLPVVERLLYKPAGPPVTRVLVLSPTRELAVQIHTVAEQVLRYCGRRVSLSLSAGGLDLRGQEAALRQGPDIVVATPGRLIDHAHNAPSFHLRNIEILVLDEADKLIDEFFIEQIKEIVRLCSPTRQVLLFSATMTDDVRELSAMALRNPVKLFLSDRADVTLRLQQEFVRIRPQRESDREAIVAALVQRTFNERAIVFCPTRRLCHRLHVLLGLLGVSCAELHSSLSQGQRLEALDKFHRSEVGVLLATDLVSRGLDIEGVRTVINYCLPSTLKVYTHRVGRTARAGKQGLAISLAGESERPLLKQIVRKAPIPVKLRTVPKSVVAAYRARIGDLEADVSAVMQDERVESAQRAAEQALNRVQKRLEEASGSGGSAAAQRNWFRAKGGCGAAGGIDAGKNGGGRKPMKRTTGARK